MIEFRDNSTGKTGIIGSKYVFMLIFHNFFTNLCKKGLTKQITGCKMVDIGKKG